MRELQFLTMLKCLILCTIHFQVQFFFNTMFYEHNINSEKQTCIFHLYILFQQKDVFQLKDIEKIAPKEKGISKYHVTLGCCGKYVFFSAVIFLFMKNMHL